MKRIASLPALALFTIGFIAVAVIAFTPLAVFGKSIINHVDGLTQYSRFVDLGLTVQTAFSGLLSGEGFFLPGYDLSMGYGQPMTYSFDPLIYLSALLPADQTEPLFCAIGIARLWLAGAAFIGFSRLLPISKNWSVVSALVYSFSSTGLNCMLQVWDINQMIFFPLVMWGAIRLMDSHRPYIYIASSTSMLLLCGSYFTYMAQIMVAITSIVHLALKRSRFTTWLKTIALYFASIAAAFLIAAPVSVTQIATLSSLDRVSIDYYVPLFYSAKYYQQMISAFLGMRFAERDWFFGYGALALVSCSLLIGAKNDRVTKTLKILLAIGTVAICIPALGSFSNGFAYPVNRWIFGFAFLIACIVGVMGTRRFAESKPQLIAATALIALYTALMALLPDARGKASWLQLGIAWIIVLTIIVSKAHGDTPIFRLAKRWQAPAIAMVSAIALGVNVALFLSPIGANWQNRLLEQGTAYDRIVGQAPAQLMKKESGDTLNRYDRSFTQSHDVITDGLLASRILNVYGTDFYNNLYVNSVDRFHRELAVAGTDMTMVYATLDQRAALETLLGMNYYIAVANDGLPLPYEASQQAISSIKSTVGVDYNLYNISENPSIAAVYNKAISSDQWQPLPPLAKQEALVQGVVVDGAERSSTTDPTISSYRVDYSISAVEGLEFKGGTIVVPKAGARIVLRVEKQPETELYLYAKHIQVKNNPGEGEYECPESYALELGTDYSYGRIQITTPASHLYGGKTTWLWNAGYSRGGTEYITIKFNTPGVYSYEEFSILAQPMGTLDEAKAALQAAAPSAMSYERDTISIEADSSGDQYLFLSVPYDTDWSATINGEKAEIIQADIAFMALQLPKGHCDVKFTYHSPLPCRIAIGLATTVLVLALWFIRIRKKSSKRRPS